MNHSIGPFVKVSRIGKCDAPSCFRGVHLPSLLGKELEVAPASQRGVDGDQESRSADDPCDEKCRQRKSRSRGYPGECRIEINPFGWAPDKECKKGKHPGLDERRDSRKNGNEHSQAASHLSHTGEISKC